MKDIISIQDFLKILDLLKIRMSRQHLHHLILTDSNYKPSLILRKNVYTIKAYSLVKTRAMIKLWGNGHLELRENKPITEEEIESAINFVINKNAKELSFSKTTGSDI